MTQDEQELQFCLYRSCNFFLNIFIYDCKYVSDFFLYSFYLFIMLYFILRNLPNFRNTGMYSAHRKISSFAADKTDELLVARLYR